MRTVSTAFRTVMCGAVLVVSPGACGAGAPAPAQVEDSGEADHGPKRHSESTRFR